MAAPARPSGGWRHPGGRRSAAATLRCRAGDERSGPRLAHDALWFDTGPLAWAADNGSKPGRQGHNWVLHATPEWRACHLDAEPEQVARTLGEGFCVERGFDPAAVSYRAAHRWLYALVADALDVGALADTERRLAVCGDWCCAPRVEGAWLSGAAAARALLGSGT